MLCWGGGCRRWQVLRWLIIIYQERRAAAKTEDLDWIVHGDADYRTTHIVDTWWWEQGVWGCVGTLGMLLTADTNILVIYDSMNDWESEQKHPASSRKIPVASISLVNYHTWYSIGPWLHPERNCSLLPWLSILSGVYPHVDSSILLPYSATVWDSNILA